MEDMRALPGGARASGRPGRNDDSDFDLNDRTLPTNLWEALVNPNTVELIKFCLAQFVYLVKELGHGRILPRC